MHTIGDYLPVIQEPRTEPKAGPKADPESEPPVFIDVGSESTPPAQPLAEKEKRPRPARPDEPDMGTVSYHAVVQGLITFQAKRQEWILAPWQVIPFSEGYEFLAEAMGLRFHRSVYHVGPNGDPLPENHGQVSYAKHSWTYATPADTICGFSGAKHMRVKVTCDRVQYLRDRLSTLDPDHRPWAAHPVEKIDLRPVMPSFWVELAEPPGGFRSPNIPFSLKQDVTTGAFLNRLVPLEHWHLLAPIPGVTSEMVHLCEREHGFRFLTNRIYLAGTGIGPSKDWKSTGEADTSPVLLRLSDLTNPAIGKLTSVIAPCLTTVIRKPKDPQKKQQKPETTPSGEQHELFSIPSLVALRNMLGDRTVAGTCVFAN